MWVENKCFFDKKSMVFRFKGRFDCFITNKYHFSGLFGSGGGWTRTTERIPGQIYSLLQLPLCDSPRMLKNTRLF